jgi:hypothetical protein
MEFEAEGKASASIGKIWRTAREHGLRSHMAQRYAQSIVRVAALPGIPNEYDDAADDYRHADER